MNVRAQFEMWRTTMTWRCAGSITMARKLADKGLQRGIYSSILAEPPSGLWAMPAARALLLGALDSNNVLSRLQPREHLMGMILNPIVSEVSAHQSRRPSSLPTVDVQALYPLWLCIGCTLTAHWTTHTDFGRQKLLICTPALSMVT